MSNGKRFALPTQKGTELFPRITQQPTKLVIKNVPPQTPLYNVVASQFAGRLKSFHAKAQQGYAISDNQQYQVSWSWGDARATYTNQFGNETLVLEVSQSVLEQLSETLTTRRLPSWALARFELPIIGNFGDPNSTYLDSTELYAVLRNVTPVRDSLVTSSGTGGIWSKPFNIIGFAGTDPKRFGPYGIQADDDTSTTEAELLIDLRPFWTPAHAPSLTIDIYADAIEQVPNHLYGYRNKFVRFSSDEPWFPHGSDISGTGAEELIKLKKFWDDFGLPHSQQSYFVDNHDIYGSRELVVHPDAALAAVTFPLRGSPGIAPPDITQGAPNFITDQQAGLTVDGWREMLMETDPGTGLITRWGYNNLIWGTFDGDPWPTVFVLTEVRFISEYTIEEIRGYIDEPYTGPGNVRGEVFYDDLHWIERTWAVQEALFNNSHWVTATEPNARNLPIIARDVPWPDEFFPSTDYYTTPPPIKQDKYLLGTLTVDIETGSIGFSKA